MTQRGIHALRCGATSLRNHPGMLHPMRIKLRKFITQSRKDAKEVKIKAIMKGKNTLSNGQKYKKLSATLRVHKIRDFRLT